MARLPAPHWPRIPMSIKIAFTGSTEVGRLIVTAAAGNLKKVSLELGGKSPNIVFGDADLACAIPGSANAIFFNQGEICAAGSRLFVHKSIFDKVVGGVADIAKKMTIGPGLDPATRLGPLVSQEQLERVCGYLDSGMKDGARAAVGGSKIAGPGYFVEPTILVDVRPEMKVVREEIFGPVVTAIPFSDPVEIVKSANDTRLWPCLGGVDARREHRTQSGRQAARRHCLAQLL